MKNGLYSASYQCGRRLAAAGCPLPYLQHIPRLVPKPKALLIHQPDGYGYLGNRVFDLCGYGGTAYIVGLRLATELPAGVTIHEWEFNSPWPGHFITWYSNPRCFQQGQEYAQFARELDSDLFQEALEGRRRITRGHPVEGLLCGTTLESMPESATHGDIARAELQLLVETGESFPLQVALTIDRSAKRLPVATTKRRRRLLFAEPDVVAGEYQTEVLGSEAQLA